MLAEVSEWVEKMEAKMVASEKAGELTSTLDLAMRLQALFGTDPLATKAVALVQKYSKNPHVAREHKANEVLADLELLGEQFGMGTRYEAAAGRKKVVPMLKTLQTRYAGTRAALVSVRLEVAWGITQK